MYYQILETNYTFKRSVNEKYLEFGETIRKTAQENININDSLYGWRERMSLINKFRNFSTKNL